MSPLSTGARQETAHTERLDHDTTELLAMVSHELCTPTNAILGWANLLSERVPDDKSFARGIEAIKRIAQVQAELIRQLMDFAWIHTSSIHFNAQQVALAPALEVSIDTVMPLARAKSIEILAHLDARAGSVAGDPAQLQQVFSNLLSNAIKFSREGNVVRVQLARRSAFAQVTVSDNGRGIRPDFLPYVFEPYRQEGPRGSSGQGGLGLGLAIVRHIVERHGGAIHAESGGEGQGATFTVVFQRAVISKKRTRTRKTKEEPSLEAI
jgi:signal transduction histidine kinase